jgi:2-iminobutanoate/2-iminopropanoate deaminase
MIEHVNPGSMARSPYFSQAVIAPAGRTLYIGGQNGVDAEHRMAEGLAAQSAQATANVQTLLEAAGATMADVVKLTILVVGDADLEAAMAATPESWNGHPTTITVARVVELARPDALIEIEAVAALPA